MPPIQNLARRTFADGDFRFFCENYFPHLFHKAWSQDHLRVIAKIERVVKNHETLAIAMPRGSGKTSLCQVSVVWAIVTGQHKFVMLVDATEKRALKSLANIKAHLSLSEKLLEDYPEAVYPIRCLEGESRRCAGQRYYGIQTLIDWGKDELVMPTVPGSRCSGSIIQVAGLTGHVRGALYVRSDGTQVRPSLAVCDDPQTDETARSVLQTAERLSIINGAIRGLAGPGLRTAIIVPCTVIQANDLADQLLSRQDNPDWHGERTKLLYNFSTNAKLWAQYAQVRHDSLQADGDGHEATDFYAARRSTCGASLDKPRECVRCKRAGECMDAGALIAWPARYDVDELSALQHAMNLKLKNPAMFAAEYQNEPLPKDHLDEELPTAEYIAAKVNGEQRGLVPMAASQLTMFIDVHDKLLYWMVCAWARDFTGYIMDYGTFPEQRRAMFSLKEAKSTLGRHFPGMGREGAIHAGLDALTDEYLGREFIRTDGQLLQIGKCLIDSGYVPDVVFSSVRKTSRLSVLTPSKGVGIGPDAKPFSQYIRKPGEQYGLHWRIPSIRGTREIPTVNIDVNYWKTFAMDRLATAQGDPGSMTLFGAKGTDHRLVADHLTAEGRERTTGRNRVVYVWKTKPTVSDNHWFDCLVGCTTAAQMLGCVLPGLESEPSRGMDRKKVKLSDLQRRTG